MITAEIKREAEKTGKNSPGGRDETIRTAASVPDFAARGATKARAIAASLSGPRVAAGVGARREGKAGEEDAPSSDC